MLGWRFLVDIQVEMANRQLDLGVWSRIKFSLGTPRLIDTIAVWSHGVWMSSFRERKCGVARTKSCGAPIFSRLGVGGRDHKANWEDGGKPTDGTQSCTPPMPGVLLHSLKVMALVTALSFEELTDLLSDKHCFSAVVSSVFTFVAFTYFASFI